MAEAPTPIAEIDHGPGKFEQFLDKHQSKLIVGALLIALGVVGYVIWSGLQEAKANEAGSALVKAGEVADYQDVIKDYPGSTAAASAMPLLADMQWEDSQPDALKTLQDFLAQHPGHPAAHTAAVSLGLRLLAQGKTEEAREKLSEVAESHPDSYIAPLACIALGDIAKSGKKISQAKEWYEKAKGDGTRSNAFLDIANARLAIASAVPPVKIKPAPPKPPKPPKPAAAEDAQPEPAPAPASGGAPGALPAPKLTTPDAPGGDAPEDTPTEEKTDPNKQPKENPDGKPEPTP